MTRCTLILALAAAGYALSGSHVPAAAQVTDAPPERPAQSPLAAYPGFGHDPEADESRFDREEMARERLIAQCMQQAGFQYTPTPSIRVEETTNIREALAAARNDPNERYVASLTPERRTQYYLALYGVPDPFTQEAQGLHDPERPEGGGCVGEALQAIPGVFAAKRVLQDQLDAMRRAVAQDSRVRAAEQRWSECMAARGYQYASPRELHAALDQAAAQALARGEKDISALERQHQEAVAAGRECAQQVQLGQTVAQVRAEHEAAFVRAHRAVLDRHLERIRNQSL